MLSSLQQRVPCSLTRYAPIELFHPRVVVHALRLHFGDRLVLHLVELAAQDHLGILEHGLRQREEHERHHQQLEADAVEEARGH